MDWNEYFMTLARAVALKSKDSTKVGAVIVGPNREIRVTGFNGPPAGVVDSPDRFVRPAKYLYANHAEANSIAFAARNGVQTDGCSAYVTHPPCAACCHTLIQAGIKAVVIGDGAFTTPARWGEENAAAMVMFHEAGVSVSLFTCEGEPS